MDGDSVKETRAHAPSTTVPSGARCRHCDAPLTDIVADLGTHPLCESYLTADQLSQMEPHYPLIVYVCRSCWLVQLEEFVTREHSSGTEHL